MPIGKRTKARASGYYTVGQNYFRIREGDELPADTEEVFYEDEFAEEPATSTDDARAAEIAEDRRSVETVSDDEVAEESAPVAQGRRGRKAK